MIKLNIPNINIKKIYEDYIYILNIKNNKVLIKEINLIKNEIYFVKIYDNKIELIKNKKEKNISYIEKSNLINRINKNFVKNNNILNDAIDINLNNIMINNGDLAIEYINDNKMNVILLNTNEIIGDIYIYENDINLNIERQYKKECLKLLKEFIYKSKKNYNIKLLIKN